MKRRRKLGGEIGGEGVGVIHVPSQAPAKRIEMHVNQAGLTDGEVWTSFVQMAQSGTLQARVIGFD